MMFYVTGQSVFCRDRTIKKLEGVEKASILAIHTTVSSTDREVRWSSGYDAFICQPRDSGFNSGSVNPPIQGLKTLTDVPDK